MPEFVFNVALGRTAELYRRVDTGDPANARLLLVPIDRGAATDATLKDYDTLAAVLGDVDVTERTTNGWSRKTITAADITPTVDDTNDRTDLDIPDQTWSSVALAGGASTDVLVCYIPDGVTPGSAATVIPLSSHPFAITPDGSAVTAVVAAAGFYRAS